MPDKYRIRNSGFTREQTSKSSADHRSLMERRLCIHTAFSLFTEEAKVGIIEHYSMRLGVLEGIS
jgi:hypothetical protein